MERYGLMSWKLALACGLVGVLVDVDHYVEYVIHSKSNRWSVIGMWNNAMKYHRFVGRSIIHHWAGMMGVTLLIGLVLLFSKIWALVLAIGFYSHMMLDYVHLRKEKIVSWKIGWFYMKESYLEIGLDVVFVVALLFLLFI